MANGKEWPGEIPIWVEGVQKWMTGLTRRTTCDDVIYALLHTRGSLEWDSPDKYAVFERWRAVERPLEGRTKIVKVWSAWGAEQCNVQLQLRRLDNYFIPPDMKHRRRTRRAVRHRAQRHSQSSCRCSERSECLQCSKLRTLEQLVKHVINQERKLQELQQRLQDTESQVGHYENRQHLFRMQQNGLDYVQASYLNPGSTDGSSSSARSEDSLDAILLSIGEDSLDEYLELCDKICDINQQLSHAYHQAQCLEQDIQAQVEHLPEHQTCSLHLQQELEAVHVELTRAVSTSVVQQQRELEVAKELVYWDAQLSEKQSQLRQLALQLEDHYQQGTTMQQGLLRRQVSLRLDDRMEGHYQQGTNLQQVCNSQSLQSAGPDDHKYLKYINPASMKEATNIDSSQKNGCPHPSRDNIMMPYLMISNYHVPKIRSRSSERTRERKLSDEIPMSLARTKPIQNTKDRTKVFTQPLPSVNNQVKPVTQTMYDRLYLDTKQIFPRSKDDSGVCGSDSSIENGFTELSRTPLDSSAIPRRQWSQTNFVPAVSTKVNAPEKQNAHQNLFRNTHPSVAPVNRSNPDRKGYGNERILNTKIEDRPKFMDHLSIHRWREEGDTNSDDTGLSSMHSDDVPAIETLV